MAPNSFLLHSLEFNVSLLTESPVCPNCHGPVSLHIGTVYQAVTAIVSVFQYMVHVCGSLLIYSLVMQIIL
jgi:hypothetical protein